jgi:hypothetical protein
MKRTNMLFLAFFAAAGSALAQNDVSYVASTGSGSLCTRAAPCATLQLAHNATNPNGAIKVVDAGDYGNVSITKPITIEGSEAVITAPSGQAVITATN